MNKVRFGFGAFGLAAILITTGCGDKAPAAPSSMAVEVTSPDATAVTTYSYTVVTLQADMTANPAWVAVPAGGRVRMVNQTARYLSVQSANCSEFSVVVIAPGKSTNSLPFRPAGKTCDYFSRDPAGTKVFMGQVAVQ